MSMKTNVELIKSFGCVVIDKANSVSFSEVNDIATKRGYIVMPEACNESVMDFLDTLKIDLNSTFYKTWDQVTSRSRFELLLDQIMHYATTYGTDFSMGNGYVVNDGDFVMDVQNFSEYKIIRGCTEEEMYTKCYDMLCSGIALKKITCDCLCSFIFEYLNSLSKYNKEVFDIDAIKNKEAVTKLCDTMKIHPSDKFSLLRYIVYKATGSSMIIQNKLTRIVIINGYGFDLSQLTDDEIIGLSSIYRRFKNIFLALKKNKYYKKSNARIINKLNRLAYKHHTPLKVGFGEDVLCKKYKAKDVYEGLKLLPTFKLISLLNASGKKMEMKDKDKDVYFVRNGKMYVKEQRGISEELRKYYIMVRTYLLDEILYRLKETCDKKYFKLPSNIELACPTSEKNFVGNYPFGSYYTLGEDNIVGIYWRNEWGTMDFDLSIVDKSGSRIGWNSYYYSKNNDIIFSGDMTNAEPEATEVLYIKKNIDDSVVYVNRYCGNPYSKFQFFFGTEKQKNKIRNNYMVNWDSIHFLCDCESPETSQQMVGMILDNKFYFSNFGCGYGLTSNNSTDKFGALKNNLNNMITVKELLSLTDMKNYEALTDDEKKEVKEEEILDLSVVNKDTLINLFK